MEHFLELRQRGPHELAFGPRAGPRVFLGVVSEVAVLQRVVRVVRVVRMISYYRACEEYERGREGGCERKNTYIIGSDADHADHADRHQLLQALFMVTILLYMRTGMRTGPFRLYNLIFGRGLEF